MSKREKRPQYITPRGVFKYPALSAPDYGTDEYPKPNGEYKVTLVIHEDDAEPLLKKLRPLHEGAMEKGREEFAKLKVEARKKLKEVTEQPLYTTVYDPETEEPTGYIEFTFKMTASGESKKDSKPWSRKPALFDAKGVPFKKVPAIWGGTEGKVSFTAAPYFIAGTGLAGLKLYLEAAQVIELVTAGQRSASSYGFGEEEGYEQEDSFGDETVGDDAEEAEGTTDEADSDDF